MGFILLLKCRATFLQGAFWKDKHNSYFREKFRIKKASKKVRESQTIFSAIESITLSSYYNSPSRLSQRLYRFISSERLN